jgi:hypothetical protein
VAERNENNVASVLKTVLEFIAKCLYPCIIIYLVIALKPSIQEINIKELINRIQTAKGGSFEFTFVQSENIGAESARLNNKIAQLELKIISLHQPIETIVSKSAIQKDVKEERTVIEKEQKQFAANSQFAILVFHGNNSRMLGQKIADGLIKIGYQSSNTATDFSELRKVQSTPGVLHIAYTENGKKLLPSVQKLIEDQKLNVKIETDTLATELPRFRLS